MITIRETKEQDAPILHEISKQAFLPIYERYHDRGNPCLRGVDDVTRRLNPEYFRAFTILEDEEIVGGIYYVVKGKGLFFDELKEGQYYLGRVYIKPERQGKKIAQTAIALCEKEFPNATWFGVDFPRELEKNRRCYLAAGFEETGRTFEVEPGLVLEFLEKRIK